MEIAALFEPTEPKLSTVWYTHIGLRSGIGILNINNQFTFYPIFPADMY